MKDKIEIFVAGFFLFFFLGLGFNTMNDKLENFFYWQEIAQNPRLLAAQINQRNFEARVNDLKPFPKKESEPLFLAAESASSVFFDKNGGNKVLFEKNSQKALPIASLTKLIGAQVVLDNYSMEQVVTVSKEAATIPGNGAGKLKSGDRFKVEDLFKVMMVESNNGAALALVQAIGEDNFVSLMNQKAEALGLKKTYFANPTGLDVRNGTEGNKSTAQELTRIGQSILFEEPIVMEAMAIKEFDLFNINGVLNHHAVNTNELLGDPLVMAGKTGETPKSGGCLLLISQAPKNKGHIISVVLNSPDRFTEMRKLLDWVRESYQW